MANIVPQTPQCYTFLHTRVSPKWSFISLGSSSRSDQIHFWAGVPLAVVAGGFVYYYPQTPASQKVVNELCPDVPHIREDAASFDFIVGQTLTKAGLPLTRRQDNAR